MINTTSSAAWRHFLNFLAFLAPRLNCIKRLVLFSLLFVAEESKAQTTIIDSTSTTGGSFQNVTNTFAANGWSNVNGVTNKWFVGTVATCIGSKGAFIGTAAANNNYTITTADISHFYRTVVFTAGETCINLSFNWKANGETGYDGIKVYLGSVGGPAPVANTAFTTTDAGATQLGAAFYDIQAACGRVAITIPAAFAGTTRRLVFSWVNDNSGGGGTGATVDNIGLYSDVPAVPSCVGSVTPANLSVGITPCNPVLTWTAPGGSVCSAATMYYIYFGTASGPQLIDSTTSLTYTLGTLSAATSYYWKIVPRNGNGPAVGCTQRIFTTGAAACSVSPGGIGVANLTAWYKPDALAIGNLTSWTTTYPTGGSAIALTDPAAPYAQVTNSNLGGTKDFNYNQYISFANNDVSAGNERYLYNTADHNLMTNSNVASDQSSYFTVFKNRAGAFMDCIMYWGTSSSNNGLQCRGFSAMAIGRGLGNTTLASRFLPAPTPYLTTVFSYTGNRSTATSMTGFYNGGIFTNTGSGSEAGGFNGMSIGAKIVSATPTFIEPFQGDEAEHIFVNTTLPVHAAERVHTYVGIKYGITLASNYTSSSDVTLYTTATPYNNNIIGIGRDDASGLVQKQSHNNDDSVRIYAGTLSTTNAANAAAISNNQSFVVMGANTGMLNATTASNAVKPAGIYSRLEREWQVTKTNYAQTFSLDIKLSSQANPLSVLTSDLRLLVDNTGNFANATVYAAGGGLTFSYNYPVITVSGISNTQIPNNSTWNITIGSVSAQTTLPEVLIDFTGSCVDKNILLQWTTAPGSEPNYFVVERSVDGTHFTAIGQVAGNGSGSAVTHYTFTDNNVAQGSFYYRLNIVDLKGVSKYTPTIIVREDCMNGAQSNFQVYPNPVINNRVQIEYTAAKDEVVTVKFENTLGQQCFSQTLRFYKGKNSQTIMLNKLSNGIYFMHTESAELRNKVIKLVLRKAD